MDNDFEEIQELLRVKAELTAKLNLLPYDGTPEIKANASGKYLYIRKRENGKIKSTYVDKYSIELHQLLLKYSKEAKDLRKQIRIIERKLNDLGYCVSDLPLRVEQNLNFARINMKANIYNQAILEGVATTFPQTETIIDNGKVYGMTASDVQKILNLKHSWEFILDRDVIFTKTNYHILCHIAKLVNEGFYENGGKIRTVPVLVGGSSYVPPLPIESDVKENIETILSKNDDAIDKAIKVCLYCMKTQIFNDGNKRASVIFANHFLISQGEGLLVVQENDVAEFKKLLVEYYENDDLQKIAEFMKAKCWLKF
ncbi:MAG: Fic family protein [Christensenellales bacterium]